MDEWAALKSMLLALEVEFKQMVTENSRLLSELDAKDSELNYLRNENVILRSNQ